jgi:hypothetical protein
VNQKSRVCALLKILSNFTKIPQGRRVSRTHLKIPKYFSLHVFVVFITKLFHQFDARKMKTRNCALIKIVYRGRRKKETMIGKNANEQGCVFKLAEYLLLFLKRKALSTFTVSQT